MSTPLAEFLVNLRFQTDSGSLNRMNSAMKGVKFDLLAIGTLAIATTARTYALGNAWLKNASTMQLATRNLGIVSKHAIQDFIGMQKAAEAVGLSFDDMASGMENIAQMKFSLGAGATSLFKLMNKDITAGMSPDQIMNKMAEGAQQMKESGVATPEIAARAQAAGLDVRTARIMAEYGKDYKEQLDKFTNAVGPGYDAHAEQALKINREQDLNKTLRMGNALSDNIINGLIAKQQALTDETNKRIKDNPEWALFEEFIGIAPEMATALTHLPEDIKTLPENIAKAWEAIMSSKIVGEMKQSIKDGITEALKEHNEGIRKLETDTGTGMMLAGGTAAILGGGTAIVKLVSFIKNWASLIEGGFGPMEALIDMFASGSYVLRLRGLAWGLGGTAVGIAGGMLYSAGANAAEHTGPIGNYQNKKDYLMQQFQAMGLSKDEAADRLANFIRESSLDPTSEGDKGKAYGLGQWHPDRQSRYAQLFGHRMQDVDNEWTALKEQALFSQWELENDPYESKQWSRAKGDMMHQDSLYSRYIERPADEAGEARERGNLRDQLKQEYNTYHITVPAGTPDPYQFGRQVGKGINDEQNARFNAPYAG